ncbi:MAG: hypothetical protein R6U64_04665 [Bacteroidales bacterium]
MTPVAKSLVGSLVGLTLAFAVTMGCGGGSVDFVDATGGDDGSVALDGMSDGAVGDGESPRDSGADTGVKK